MPGQAGIGGRGRNLGQIGLVVEGRGRQTGMAVHRPDNAQYLWIGDKALRYGYGSFRLSFVITYHQLNCKRKIASPVGLFNRQSYSLGNMLAVDLLIGLFAQYS